MSELVIMSVALPLFFLAGYGARALRKDIAEKIRGPESGDSKQ